MSLSLLGYHCLLGDGILQVERLLDCSTSFAPNPLSDPKATAPLTDEARQMFADKAESLASQGLRVIALGQRLIRLDESGFKLEGATRESVEQDFTLLALVGIFDPPRPETVGAVRACQRAGIVVHMCVQTVSLCCDD